MHLYNLLQSEILRFPIFEILLTWALSSQIDGQIRERYIETVRNFHKHLDPVADDDIGRIIDYG